MMVGVRVLVPSVEDEKMKGIPAVKPPLCFLAPLGSPLGLDLTILSGHQHLTILQHRPTSSFHAKAFFLFFLSLLSLSFFLPSVSLHSLSFQPLGTYLSMIVLRGCLVFYLWIWHCFNARLINVLAFLFVCNPRSRSFDVSWLFHRCVRLMVMPMGWGLCRFFSGILFRASGLPCYCLHFIPRVFAVSWVLDFLSGFYLLQVWC